MKEEKDNESLLLGQQLENQLYRSCHKIEVSAASGDGSKTADKEVFKDSIDGLEVDLTGHGKVTQELADFKKHTSVKEEVKVKEEKDSVTGSEDRLSRPGLLDQTNQSNEAILTKTSKPHEESSQRKNETTEKSTKESKTSDKESVERSSKSTSGALAGDTKKERTESKSEKSR